MTDEPVVPEDFSDGCDDLMGALKTVDMSWEEMDAFNDICALLIEVGKGTEERLINLTPRAGYILAISLSLTLGLYAQIKSGK